MNLAKMISILLTLSSLLVACGPVSTSVSKETSSPNVDATVQAAVVATIAAQPSLSPSVQPAFSTPTIAPVNNVRPTPQTFTDAHGVTMAVIPGGTYQMGGTEEQIAAAVKLCAEGDSRTDAAVRCEYNVRSSAPAHQVTVQSFSLDIDETTNAQYRACAEAGACKVMPTYDKTAIYDENRAEFPVMYMDQNGASEYCAWRGARLPDEAEWEYAARGPESLVYPWGNEFDETISSTMKSDWRTKPVGTNSVDISWTGVHDLADGPFEWTKVSPYSPPMSDGSTPDFVLRGGNFSAYTFQGMWRGGFNQKPFDPIYANVPLPATIRCAQSGASVSGVSSVPNAVRTQQANGRICVLAFGDKDGNGGRSGDEPLLTGINFALSDNTSLLSTYNTDGHSEPYCFGNLVAGAYVIQARDKVGRTATTPGQWAISLADGAQFDVAYGIQVSESGSSTTSVPSANPTKCSADELKAFDQSLRTVIGAPTNDLLARATQEPRTQQSALMISGLQAIRRDATLMIVPACAQTALDLYIKYLDKAINSYTLEANGASTNVLFQAMLDMNKAFEEYSQEARRLTDQMNSN